MIKKAAFAMGCFWGPELLFSKIKGIVSTKVGYMGGDMESPGYEQVSTGSTGHAETVLVEYDEDTISYKELLEFFWENHDPTTKDRQGPDHGSQYRSIIFYFDDEQKSEALKSLDKLETSKKYENEIVTEIIPASDFYEAEEYHQKYLEKRGQNVCH